MNSNLKTAAIVLSMTLVALAIWRKDGGNQVSTNPNQNPPMPNSGVQSTGGNILPKPPRGTQYKCRHDLFYKEHPGSPRRHRIIVEPPIPGAKFIKPNGDYMIGTDYGCYIPVSAGKCVAFKWGKTFGGLPNEWQKCDPKSANVDGRKFQDPDTGEWYYFFSSDYLFVLQ